MMNRTWKSVFSVLLAIALLLPMVPVARAEGTPTVDLTTNVASNTIYYRDDDDNGTIEVTATVTDDSGPYSGTVKWELTGPLSFVSSERESTLADGKATIKLKAGKSAEAEATATVKASVTGANASRSITVAQDRVNTSSIVFSQTEISVEVGKTAQLSFNKTPAYPSGISTKPKVTYISSNTSAVTVDGNGKVTGIAEGRAVISAQVDGIALNSNSTVVISVLSPSTSLGGNATLGVNFSMQDIYDKLRSQYRDAYGVDPTHICFPGLNTANATLRDKNGKAIAANDPYTISEFREMYLEPTGEGTFTCSATVADSLNFSGTRSLSATLTVTVSAPSVTIRIPIDGSANYSFGRASADSSGKTGAQLIKDAIGAFGSITFGTAEGSNAGTLYTSSSVSNDTRVTQGTFIVANLVDELYFTPSRAGTYSVPFTAYLGPNGYGSVVCTGTLILPVDGTSLDLTANLDSVKPFTFSEKPSGSTTALYLQLINAINSSIGGSTWGGIKFDGAASASSTGTLHETSSHSRAISASDYISKTNIASLYYVPERSGTYEITYGVYDDGSSTRAIATGKLTIRTSTISAGASDITYTTSVKNSVTLRESDFIDFFQTENGGRYQLSYVVFNEYDGGGTFYHSANSFLPYNSADFYTSTYTGSVPANARYLDRLSFTAPASAGYTAVLFTCYGGTTTDSTNKITTGKLCIYYSADNVPAVSYDVSGLASVSVKESDFVTVYNAVMKSSVSRPSFYIQLLNAPDKGTLYHYYSGNNNRALTTSNIANYTFLINDRSGYSVEDLSYVPGRNASGADEIVYLATSTSGAILYVGTIQFVLSSDLTLNVTNDGSNFQLSNFYNASDSDPVVYVTFPQPSTGRVYVYAGGRYIAAPVETKFYTASASDGQYPITSAFYAPKANETGTVSLKYVMHRKSGLTRENSITVNVLSKTSSGTFRDVGDVTGWAANSIDFASKMGLVNGTQLNPPLFSPSSTMRRSDFVLMLYRLAGSPAVSGSAPYTDVPVGKYYYDSAVWAYNNNIVRNVTINGLYNPEGALTRQDFAQILFNYTRAMGESTAYSGTIASYADASSVSSTTLEGVTWAVSKGYITSAVVGRLYIEPTRSATRAEISTLLHRYLTY